MGKTADLTVVQKTTIDTLHKEGKKQKVIAKEAGCSQSSVSKHINREAKGRKRSVVGKVHRSSTWVKVQIRIIKYYSIKSKSTAFSILLEWKCKSTQFFMYLSKKVLIYRFILQFYIEYFI